jgi:hypothetical protein
MKKSRFTEVQIIGILKQHEGGLQIIPKLLGIMLELPVYGFTRDSGSFRRR